MNRQNQQSFRTVMAAISAYKRDVNEAFQDYGKQAETAKDTVQEYKQPDVKLKEILAPKKLITRNIATRAKERMNEIVRGEIKNLKAEFANHSLMMPSSTLLSVCQVFREYGICPTRTQVEGMLKLTTGGVLSYAVVNKTLEDTKSPYKLEYISLETLEKDIDDLERLAGDYAVWFPRDLNVMDVLNETPVIGASLAVNYDAVRLASQIANFEALEKRIDGMAARWTDDVSPRITQIKNNDLYPGDAEQKAADFLADQESTGSDSTKITTESPAVERAKELYRDRTDYREVMDNYLK